MIIFLGIIVFGAGVLGGYSLACHLSDQRKIQQVLNSELAQQAIAFYSLSSGISISKTERMVKRSIAQLNDEGIEALLTSYASKIIGNPRCANNAYSSYLRCAINPDGPCDLCRHFKPS